MGLYEMTSVCKQTLLDICHAVCGEFSEQHG
jgi:hypothetical protein